MNANLKMKLLELMTLLDGRHWRKPPRQPGAPAPPRAPSLPEFTPIFSSWLRIRQLLRGKLLKEIWFKPPRWGYVGVRWRGAASVQDSALCRRHPATNHLEAALLSRGRLGLDGALDSRACPCPVQWVSGVRWAFPAGNRTQIWPRVPEAGW